MPSVRRRFRCLLLDNLRLMRSSFWKHRFVFFLFSFFFFHSEALPQDTLLSDRNADGLVRFSAFGDSLVFGVGDGTFPGEFIEEAAIVEGGFPQRVEALLSIPVDNLGLPGEVFTDGGLQRLVGSSINSLSDAFVILEGTNDALFQTSPTRFARDLQKGVNALRAQEYQVFLATLPPSCCNRTAQRFFERQLNDRIRDVIDANPDIVLVDCERAFDILCPDPESCFLFNDPEGLHPNSVGYQLISELTAAAALGIDAFQPGASLELESALGLEPGSATVIVPAPPSEEEQLESEEVE